MHARSTTFRSTPQALQAGITMVREEVMPAMQRLDGCLGLSMLVDRESGGAVVTSSWADEAAMRTSEQQVAPVRDHAAQVFASRPEVREWEIAVLHRMRPVPEGAWARVVWTRTEPGVVEAMLDVFRMLVLPQVEDLPGFCSTSLLVDRRTGRGALATTYDSRDAMVESRDTAMGLRVDATSRTSAQVLDVAELEVALAHLRVPETV